MQIRTVALKFVSSILSSTLLLGGLAIPSEAQRRAIVVSAEQPNVWTLEQAHYLLAQMHRRNLDLKATGLGELDPNEINGLNFDVLRTLLEFGVAFNEADRFNNSLLKTRKSFDADRAIKLQKRRDDLADESLALNRDIARLGREQALADNESEKAKLAAQVAELKTVKEGVDKEVTRLDDEIKAAGGPSGDLKPTEAETNFDASKLPKSTFDDAFKDVTKKLIDRFNEAPKLNATIRLDNFLQMQYEIIAKQLTLLRDEVGPGERIIFLELPQTVNASYDKANKKWAQSWWKVAGYTAPKSKIPNTREGSLRRLKAQGPVNDDDLSLEEARASFFTDSDVKDKQTLAGLLKTPTNADQTYVKNQLSATTTPLLAVYAGGEPTAALSKGLVDDFNTLLLDSALFSNVTVTALSPALTVSGAANPAGIDRIRLNRSLLEAVFPGVLRPRPAIDHEPLTMSRIVDDARAVYGTGGNGSSNRVDYFSLESAANTVEPRKVRAIELIPRQSSLNVNDIKLRARSGVLTAVAKTLFGVGARLNFQRQRETFSQFVQQELYSSGFGKGAREFGWTFTPMPGTDRVLSGTRTTYAVMVVPDDAEALVMKSSGCFFPRNDYQPTSFADMETASNRWTERSDENRQCSEIKTFAVPIPGGGERTRNDEFWVDGLEYEPADKSDRVVVTIYGRNFPAQIGMMVDGIPLTQTIGVAQPLIRDDSLAFAAARTDLKDAKIIGSLERIDAYQLIAVFERPTGKDGTQPILTLTAPGKAKILNRLPLYINGHQNIALRDADLLFGKRPPKKDKFRIDKVEVFRGPAPWQLTALVHGEGLAYVGGGAGTGVLVNGRPVLAAAFSIESPALLRIRFPIPADENIRVTLTANDPDPASPPSPDPTTIESDAVPNPAFLRITSVSVISYEAATDEEPATLVVKIEGSGFSDDLRSSIGELAVKSATEAILKITDPQAAAVVILTDRQTGQQVRTIVTRKTEASRQ